MSMSKQLQDFNLNFVQETMREWRSVAQTYENETQKIYTKLRSYLTIHQFRLNDQEKCEIREMLSQELDELEKVNFIEDMDNYLDGFCFNLDKSILPKRQPKEVKIQIAPEPHLPQLQQKELSIHAPIERDTFKNPTSANRLTTASSKPDNPSVYTNNSPLTPAFDNAVDYDIFEMMFNY